MSSILKPGINYGKLDLSKQINFDDKQLFIQISEQEFLVLITKELKVEKFLVYSWINNASWEQSFKNIKALMENDLKNLIYFKKTEIIYLDKFFSLIPNEFFNKSKIADFIIQEYPEYKDEKIINDEINSEIQYLYFIKKDLFNYIDNLFTNYELYNHSASLINLLNNKDEKLVNVFVHNSFFELILWENGLRLFNILDFKTDKEFVYLLINSLNNLGYNNDVEVNISGKINSASSIFKLLQKYLKNINLETGMNKESEEKININYYKIIFSKAEICEL